MLRTKTLAIALTLLAGCGSAENPNEADVGATASPLLVSTNQLYPSAQRTIPICVSSGSAEDQEWVKHALARTWARESAMAFDFVGNCNATNLATSVKIRTWQGTDWFADWELCGLDVANGDASGTNHQVGLALLGSGTEVPVCHFRARPRGAARGFGFILGFREELAREDTWSVPACDAIQTAPASQGFEMVGPYDDRSVMNRCGSVLFGLPTLSATDIDGVQKFYGHAQPIAQRDRGSSTAQTIFVRGRDNALWENTNASDQALPAWTSHGGALGGAPAVANVYGNAHVFVRLNDGSLGQRWWSGTSWVWTNHGLGPAFGIKGKPAVITDPTGQQVRVFVRGIDDRLYQYFWNGGSWAWSRVNDDYLIAGDVAVVSPLPDRYSVFAIAGNHLIELSWDGAAWRIDDHSEPIPGGQVTRIRGVPQAITYGGTDIKVFVEGEDGSLYERYRQGSVWRWAGHGGVIRGMPAIEGPFSVWARGVDDNLWQNYWNGSAWVWVAHTGLPMTASPSAIGIDRRDIFVRRADGGVSERRWIGGGWTWIHRHGQLVLP